MGYKPKKGGYKYNRIRTRGKTATRDQRQIITHIVTRGPTREELYQLLTKIALLSSQIDDVLDDLAEFDE